MLQNASSQILTGCAAWSVSLENLSKNNASGFFSTGIWVVAPETITDGNTSVEFQIPAVFQFQLSVEPNAFILQSMLPFSDLSN